MHEPSHWFPIGHIVDSFIVRFPTEECKILQLTVILHEEQRDVNDSIECDVLIIKSISNGRILC